jgi:hypothetical protein
VLSGYVCAIWIPTVVAHAQVSTSKSTWGELSIQQHVAGTPWFGMDVVTGCHDKSSSWVTGVHHQGWEAWQQHSVSAGQGMDVGALAVNVLVHVGVDRWPMLHQVDPWASLEARFSHMVDGSGTFTLDWGWNSRVGFPGQLTWSSSWQPPNPTGLLGCPQFIWSQHGQWGVRWNPDPNWLDDLRLWRRWSPGLQLSVGGPRWVAEVGWSWSPSMTSAPPAESTTTSMGRPGTVSPRRHWCRIARGQRGVATFNQMSWRWEE